MLRSTPHDFCEMDCNSPAGKLPTFGIFRSMTYFGIRASVQYVPQLCLAPIRSSRTDGARTAPCSTRTALHPEVAPRNTAHYPPPKVFSMWAEKNSRSAHWFYVGRTMPLVALILLFLFAAPAFPQQEPGASARIGAGGSNPASASRTEDEGGRHFGGNRSVDRRAERTAGRTPEPQACCLRRDRPDRRCERGPCG